MAAAVLLTLSGAAFAGPPFMTDDPEPIEYKHSEAYLFSTYDKGPDGSKQVVLPAFEYNTSPIEDVHLHIVVPFANSYPSDGSGVQHGIGDVELGVKYRFVHETDTLPQVGVFPMLELPTGNVDKGLGNGRAWWTLPLWGPEELGRLDHLRWRRTRIQQCTRHAQLLLRRLAGSTQGDRASDPGRGNFRARCAKPGRQELHVLQCRRPLQRHSGVRWLQFAVPGLA